MERVAGKRGNSLYISEMSYSITLESLDRNCTQDFGLQFKIDATASLLKEVSPVGIASIISKLAFRSPQAGCPLREQEVSAFECGTVPDGRDLAYRDAFGKPT